jgi:hypothetical protein
MVRLFYCRVLTKQTDISDATTKTGQEGWGRLAQGLQGLEPLVARELCKIELIGATVHQSLEPWLQINFDGNAFTRT